MNGFLKTIIRECCILLNNRFMLFVLFVLPIIFACISVSVFISGVATDLPIAICDQDNSDLSRNLTRTVNSTPACKIKFKTSDLREGKDILNGGAAYALLLIPKNFKSDLSLGKRPQIICYYNNQMILVGGVIIKDIQTAISNFIKGASAQIQMKTGVPKYAISSKIMPISFDERVKANPYSNYSYFLTYAAIAHIFQIIATLLAVWTIGREFRYGTTSIWLKNANGSICSAVFGKLFFYNTILLMMLFAIYFSYVLFCSAPFKGNILFSIFGAWIFLFAYQMMGTAFMSVLSNLRFAMSVGAFYTSLGFSFSGMTFPAIALPEFGQFYSSLLPVRPFVNLIINQALRGFSPIYDVKYIFGMLLISIPGILLLPFLKQHAQDESLCYQL